MLATRIYQAPVEVEDRLAFFGVSKSDFFPIIEQVIAARADTIALDSKMNAGMKAFLAGLRHTRLLFSSKGYIPDDTFNIESSIHPETGIKVIYQNVDIACSLSRSPRAISKKGSASKVMVEDAQGFLFDPDEAPEVFHEEVSNSNESIWYFCVAVNGNEIAAELSCPTQIARNNFDGFIERVFIVKPGEWEVREIENGDADEDDYQVEISRKE